MTLFKQSRKKVVLPELVMALASSNFIVTKVSVSSFLCSVLYLILSVMLPVLDSLVFLHSFPVSGRAATLVMDVSILNPLGL